MSMMPALYRAMHPVEFQRPGGGGRRYEDPRAEFKARTPGTRRLTQQQDAGMMRPGATRGGVGTAQLLGGGR